ncbi:AT-rich interactive domain-containing protein 3B isoform X3 [Monodelphis domestica]|uniref:AT-rich interactive domain-containing protein 3B isoform X3 n=2 Tax=Monodelphis domestica TaxID=13616 RepID=UPI0024E1B164|nr:AT-rich interactive domain-containing protein 3B isoform X3 [Monodelphis domestica]
MRNLDEISPQQPPPRGDGGGREPLLRPEGSSVDPVCLLGRTHLPSHANRRMRLEAVMEQLQKHQKQQQQQQQHPAPIQMESRERQERQMREAQLLYAQQLASQQANLTPPSSKASGNPALGPLARAPPGMAASRSVNSEPDEEEEGVLEDEEGDGEEAEIIEKEAQHSSKYFHVQKVTRHDPRPTSMLNPPLPASGLQRGLQIKDDHARDASKGSPSVPASGHPNWNLEEQLKQNGGLTWSDDADGGRGREISRDFAKLYELDSDPERKEFLDDLFIFMQKRGTPINRIPIMAKQILDLYMLYKLVTEKGGLVEIINKKIWREITKGLNLPTSITSAAFTLRTQYMKYLYAYECEKKALSSPAELQAAIDGNRREGRRPSYSSSLFSYSPTTPGGPTSLLSPPKIRFPILGLTPSGSGGSNSPRLPPAATLRKAGDGVTMSVPMPNRLAVPVTLAGGQQAGTRTSTLEQLRERLEAGEPPEKKVSRMTEEEQRFVQQAFHRNLLSVARQLPMKVKINGREDRSEAAAALNLSTSGIGSINMSVEINGTIYAGVLFAQKPVVHLIASPAPQSTCSSSSSVSSHCSPSPTSSRGTPSAEPSTSWAL